MKKCKLELDNRIIKQTLIFNYMRVEVTSSRKIIKEVTAEANKPDVFVEQYGRTNT